MKNLKRVLAVICIVILAGLYVTTFFMALFDSSSTMFMFKGCIACTIFVPVVAYFFMCLHKYAMKHSGRADDDPHFASDTGSASSDDTQ